MFKKFISMAILVMVVFAFIPLNAQMPLWNPNIHGSIGGVPGVLIIPIDTDLTADTFLLGDTSSVALFYYPPFPMEITDVKVWSNNDAGDSALVVIYSCEGTSGSQIAAATDTCVSTKWLMTDSCSTYGTLSSTYKCITPTEGMAVLFDFIAASPNDWTVIIEYVTRLKDPYE